MGSCTGYVYGGRRVGVEGCQVDVLMQFECALPDYGVS